jgi:peptide-methionine (R)-S-oxide reductase
MRTITTTTLLIGAITSLAYFSWVGNDAEAAEKIAPMGPPVEKVVKSDAEWKQLLTPEQYGVLRRSGTERAFTSELLEVHEPGTFVCAACGLELFRSEDKFDSGTGWPSFTRPYFLNNVREISDTSLGMPRVEIRCARCDGHLGHVFPDGPKPTRLRYCMNGDAMKFVPAKPAAP